MDVQTPKVTGAAGFWPALFLFFLFGCGGPHHAGGVSYEILLGLMTADGLKPGAAVFLGQKEVGRISQIGPAFNQVEAVVRFENEFRPSDSARFFLERREDGGRIIRILDGNPPSARMPAGRKVQVQIPVETLEDRMWVTK